MAFSKGNDIVLPGISIFIFGISFFFMSMVLNGFIVFYPFKLFVKIRHVIDWYDIKYTKTDNYYDYVRKTKKNIFLVCIIFIISFVVFLFSFTCHIRFYENKIYYTRFISLNEKEYTWSDVHSIEAIPELVKNRNGTKSIDFKLILTLGTYKIDIWQWADINNIKKIITTGILEGHIYPHVQKSLPDETEAYIKIDSQNPQIQYIQLLEYINTLTKEF
jgi:hypothetical protein